MDTRPVFSIIIPTYDSGDLIAKAIESILKQTYRDFEVLIIDGLSSDRTLDVCNSFNDDRVKILSEKDAGIYDAMNKGIKLAKGDWLYFLGSDDTLYDCHVLQDVDKFISRTESPIIYGNVKIQGNAGWALDGQIYDGSFDLTKLLQKNIAHQCIFYSKRVIQYEDYNLKYTVCADYDLNLRLFSKYQFKYFDRVIANFKGGGYSVIAKDNNFSIPEAAIRYFFSSIWRKEFFFMKEGIRRKIDKESHLVRKLYLYLVYFKHRLLKQR